MPSAFLVLAAIIGLALAITLYQWAPYATHP